jgi:hypothetical protein
MEVRSIKYVVSHSCGWGQRAEQLVCSRPLRRYIPIPSPPNAPVSVSYTAILFSRALLLVFPPFPPRFHWSAPRRCTRADGCSLFWRWLLLTVRCPIDDTQTFMSHWRKAEYVRGSRYWVRPKAAHFHFVQILNTYYLSFIYTDISHGITKELKFVGFCSLKSPLRMLAALWIARQTFHTSCCIANSRSLSLRLADREMASAIPGKNENLLS